VDDREFVDAFEACTLPPSEFHHRDHVRLAWIYLREHDLLSALTRFVTSLKRYAASLGAASKYHATITWAFLFLIHERMQQTPGDDFAAFAERNPDLFSWRPSLLEQYYSPETLGSELARQTFVMPNSSFVMANRGHPQPTARTRRQP
jgi:hypothetical protein